MRAAKDGVHPRQPASWGAIGVLFAALALSAGDRAGAADDRWLLYWTAARPSRAAAFEAAWRQGLAPLRGQDAPILTLVSTSHVYAFLTPLGPGEGRGASLRLGPPEPEPPAGTSIDPGTGARSWVLAAVQGRPPDVTPADRALHLDLWFVEPTMTREAELRLRAWSEETVGVWLLRAVDGPDLPLWVSLRTDDEPHRSDASLATRLAPVLRASTLTSVTLRSDLSIPATPTARGTVAAGAASPMEPIEPLSGTGLGEAATASLEPSFGERIVLAARQSVRRAPTYDTGYEVLAYPGGDPGWQTGSSVDVLIRALRQVGIDLQQRVHEDLLEAPAAYGAVGRQLDTNIDHRRLRHLLTYFERHAERLPTGQEADWRPGDIVVWDVFGNGIGGHIGIVTAGSDDVPWVIHHFPPEAPFSGRPAEDPVLSFWPRVGHYRLSPPDAGQVAEP